MAACGAGSKTWTARSFDRGTVPGVHEQTPLLGSNPVSANTFKSDVSPPPKEPAEDASDLETGHIGSDSLKDGPKLKTAAGVASVIPVLLIGVFISNADSSLVLATDGIISSELGSLANASWLVVTYGLTMCAVQSMYGKLSDIFGRKAMLITAYSIFASGCALCGLGLTFWQVVLGRAISGLGGAGMTSLVAIYIADNVPLRDVAVWRSYVNMAATIGRSAGGPLGGLFADTVGWRWSFLLQCPLALVAIVLVAWKLNGPDSSSSPPETEGKSRFRRIDFLGSAAIAATISTFILALDLGGQQLPWSHPFIWILIASSALCGLIFLLIEAFVAHEPIISLRLLVQRDMMTTNALGFLQSVAQFGVLYTVPLYFQVTARTSVTVAGAHLFPAVGGNAVASIIGGIIIRRTASYKFLVIAATVIASASYVLLIVFWKGNTNIWESLYITPGGFGSGLLFASAFVGLTASVDGSQVATATAVFFLSSNIGAIVGASLAGTALETSLRSQLTKTLQGIPDGGQILKKALSDLEYVKSLTGPIRNRIVGAYVQGFEYSHEISLACSVLSIFIAISMREHSLK